MKNYFVKLVVTNDINDDRRIEWSFFDTEEERDKWIAEMKEEEDKWNYKTPGSVSFRDYDFEYYNMENIMNSSMSEFEGMSFSDFIMIMKNCL